MNPWIFILHFGLLLLFSHPVVSDSLQPHGRQHARPLCPSPSPEICPSSRPLHQWCHPVTSSSDALFFCPQSLGNNPILFYVFSGSSCSNSGSWELFLCPFDVFPSLCVLILPNFLALNDVPGSSYIFTTPDLESAALQGIWFLVLDINIRNQNQGCAYRLMCYLSLLRHHCCWKFSADKARTLGMAIYSWRIGQRSLEGYSPWGCKESDMTEVT